MSYLSATELAVILPPGASVGASTMPINLGETATIIAQVGAEVDGYLSAAGFGIPISTTATTAYAQIQRIVTQGAAAQVLNSILSNMGGQSKTTLASEYADSYRNALKMIADKKLALPGVSPDTGETGRALPRSFQTSNPGADAAGYAASPLIQMIWEP